MLNVSLSEIHVRMTLTAMKPRKFVRGNKRNSFLLAPNIAKAYMLSVSEHMRSKV